MTTLAGAPVTGLEPGPLETFRAGPGVLLHDDEARALWAAAGDATRGGRGVRPHLLRVAYASLGGTDETACAQLADAVELLHAAFVVHDDVIDHDDVRRGRPNVSGTFTARAVDAGASGSAARGYGRAAGILAGDLALVAATRSFATVPARPEVVADLLALLDRTVALSAAGELHDVRLALQVDEPRVADTLAVAELKTAVYSFSLPLSAGAILAGATTATVAALDRVGRLVGTAFQLHDDLLGVFGDEARTGKSALSDLREGKVTALVAHARTTPAWPQVAPAFGDPALTPRRAREVREHLERCGSRAFVTDLVDEHLTAAQSLARDAGLPEAVLRSLRTLVDDDVWSAG
ncbi:polyprenyl synthetase family protein [Cellulomonas gelida]|uniref:Geranylgeranyl pyrophosphate synthase n=1 Tax=Cellulomonas gelida TaxID=1712 RepID=A0A4Y3KQZ0_9CELL|nr:polyprenyl synthetase family protein [Cellulomonas gelida]GEA85380.1 geranylgeranyl pyrophosphate synthase [Cellulomonas gelida]GGL36266.1 geranylgeranyl pyrophosphate synthase [Cellulomonas gelida]